MAEHIVRRPRESSRRTGYVVALVAATLMVLSFVLLALTE